MNNNDEKIVNVATNLIIAILNYGEVKIPDLLALHEITIGNKKMLLEHLKAVNNITGKAIEILGGNKNE